VKRALISDVHSNLEALDAVLEDIHQQGISEVYCLGDIVGYGPNPRECLDKVMELDVCILGNHDEAVLFDPVGFNLVALRAILWTRDQLKGHRGESAAAMRRRDFLGELPRIRTEEHFMFVHGSPLEPTNDYVFPGDAFDAGKMEALFDRIERYCFQGHTHMPGVFTHGEFISPEECNFQYRLTDEKVMINVGSVGQPRDGDPRACYVVLIDDQVTFRRVEYDIDTTVEKIYAIVDLENSLGDRLRDVH
jgi:predicted phosphodiesterase